MTISVDARDLRSAKSGDYSNDLAGREEVRWHEERGRPAGRTEVKICTLEQGQTRKNGEIVG